MRFRKNKMENVIESRVETFWWHVTDVQIVLLGPRWLLEALAPKALRPINGIYSSRAKFGLGCDFRSSWASEFDFILS